MITYRIDFFLKTINNIPCLLEINGSWVRPANNIEIKLYKYYEYFDLCQFLKESIQLKSCIEIGCQQNSICALKEINNTIIEAQSVIRLLERELKQ